MSGSSNDDSSLLIKHSLTDADELFFTLFSLFAFVILFITKRKSDTFLIGVKLVLSIIIHWTRCNWMGICTFFTQVK